MPVPPPPAEEVLADETASPVESEESPEPPLSPQLAQAAMRTTEPIAPPPRKAPYLVMLPV